jgi:hypothetical protein
LSTLNAIEPKKKAMTGKNQLLPISNGRENIIRKQIKADGFFHRPPPALPSSIEAISRPKRPAQQIMESTNRVK